MLRITYISIGDELLRGRIVNTNARMLAHLLRPAGFSMRRIVTIGDEPEDIKRTVREELAQADVLLISGGLGPTKDDLTKHTLSSLFDMELTWHQPTADYLEMRYAEAKLVLNDSTRQQALMPDGCTVLPNDQGTAPGMLFEEDDKMIFSLPGVPFELKHLVNKQVLPRLSKLEGTARFYLQKVLRTSGISESSAAESLNDVHEIFPPYIKLAYLPRRDGLWLELQAIGPIALQTEGEKRFEEIFSRMREAIGDRAYAESGEELPDLLGSILLEKELSIATAESLTAGMMAARIVETSGASRYYKGGVVAYETAQKTSLLDVPAELIETHGVVSQAVAKAMAKGARERLGTDVALSTTGLAERDQKEGTFPHAWVAFATADGVEARHVRLYGDRNETRARCADAAMILAVKQLGKKG